jgi:hypothetical protein
MARGGIMYCKICGENRDVIRIFSINMCKECFNELSFISVNDEKYDVYKNLIRILLSYYIGDKQLLNPVN